MSRSSKERAFSMSPIKGKACKTQPDENQKKKHDIQINSSIDLDFDFKQ